MRKVYCFTLMLVLAVAITACGGRKMKADAFGAFEADEVLISAQAEGQVTDFSVNTGSKVEAGTYVASIDSSRLLLQKEQLLLQKGAFLAQYSIIPDKYISWQDSLVAIEQQLYAITDKARNNEQWADSMAWLTGKKQYLTDTIRAWQDEQTAQIQGPVSQLAQMYVQLRQLNNAIAKCYIVSPIQGTLLNKYVNTHELIGMGYPVAKVADLNKMTLKVYVSEKQLADIQLGDTCTVRIDKGKKVLKQYTGHIEWISDQSEFTPKMIQTKDERVNLVYAVKIAVNNDGSIKIGMPGEAKFKCTNNGKRNKRKQSE